MKWNWVRGGLIGMKGSKHLVEGSAAGLGEAVVVEGRGV